MNHETEGGDRDLEALLSRLPPPPLPSPTVQNAARGRALEKFDQAIFPSPADFGWRRIIHKGAVVMSHPMYRIVTAAAAVLALAVWLAIPHKSAFGELLDAIVNAKSAKFKMTAKSDVQPKQEFFATGFFLAPNQFRQEMNGPDHFKMETIADFDRGRMMTLIPETKQAIIVNIKGKASPENTQAANFFSDMRARLEEYRTSKKGLLEELGETMIEGHQAFGFRLVTAGMVQTYWGDHATKQIVRVESVYNGPPKMDVVMTDFEFDVALEPSMFSLDVPEGYQSNSVSVDASPPTESDFIASLRKLSDVSDGEFPASLDTVGMASSMVKLLTTGQKPGEKTKDQKPDEKMMQEAVSIGRGMSFAMMLPLTADAHYAGKGLKRTGPKSPLFWYKPTVSKKYRVVWSDLSASDADEAPNVPGAIRLIQPVDKAKGESCK
jgi:outer membrane lipoprotein-sorting protein